ncbi:MAG: SDR family NAD(P)-dependent oxidoreductase [Clostridiales bacterium]|nr:SDR family NAD(P)-dependent oxidoreductase [Clostridiales bacterium]
MGKLEGKVAIVTGAARGIGRDVAKRLAEEGTSVVLADINPKVLETANEVMTEVPGSKCIGAVVDVSSGKEVDNLVQKAVDEFGRLDIMFNNAGINQKMTPLAETEDSVFDRIININLRGVFNGSRAATKQMLKQGGGGYIINTASYYGKRGYAYFAVYCASKAAVINFTQAHALEAIKHNIRVNCICPGNMMTEMHKQSLREEAELKGTTFDEMREFYRKSIPVQRHGTGDDIAGAVVFLCSEDGSYTIGEAINVSGGLEMN